MATSDGTPALWHINVSHYSEKARWALDHKRVPNTRRAVSIPGRAIGDSTEIIAVLEERYPERPLYPADAEQRRRALELELELELEDSVADLSAAALFTPLVLPDGGPVPNDETPPAGLEEFRTPLAERPGYRWVEEMYWRHR